MRTRIWLLGGTIAACAGAIVLACGGDDSATPATDGGLEAGADATVDASGADASRADASGPDAASGNDAGSDGGAADAADAGWLGPPGTFDTAFAQGDAAVGGVVGDNTLAGAIGPDGKIVTLGQNAASSPNTPVYVVRFTTDGQPDRSFGDAGLATTTLGLGGSISIGGVGVQADGKIVVAAYPQSTASGAVGRLTTSGATDPSFGDAGNVYLPTTGYIYQRGVILDDAGAFVGIGSLSTSPIFLGAWRVTSAGVADFAFGDAGVTGAVIPSYAAYPAGIVRQSSGAIVVGGVYYVKIDGGNAPFGVAARFTSTGALDSSFGSNGLATVDGLGAEEIAVGPDDSIVLAGGTEIVHLSATGQKDGSFGASGQASVASFGGWINAILVGPTGNLYVTGYDASNAMFVARFTPAGALDPAFGTGGVLTAAAPSEGDALAFDAEGRLVVIGTMGGPNVKYAKTAVWRVFP